jgi:hypothetical protein
MQTESDQHMEPLRLVEFSRDSGFQLTDEESMHLLDCAECQELFVVLILWFKQRLQGNGPPLRYASEVVTIKPQY